MERIRKASHDELRAILLTFCDDRKDDVDNNDMHKRVLSYLRVLQYLNDLPVDGPKTIDYNREASETELRAIVLTICEDSVTTRDMSLDFLRVMGYFKSLQDDQGVVYKNGSVSSNDVGKAQIEGTTKGSDTSYYLEELSCIECEKVYNEADNHPKACKRHSGKFDCAQKGKIGIGNPRTSEALRGCSKLTNGILRRSPAFWFGVRWFLLVLLLWSC